VLDEHFVLLGAAIGLLGGCAYLLDTLKGKIRPNKVSWFIWSLAPLIAFGAELQEGVGLRALTTFVVAFNPLLIFAASFVNRDAAWRLTRFDLYCGLLALVGLVLWYLTRAADIAIIFSILSDALAAIPTVVKSYHSPETENYFGFLALAVASGITLLTIRVWTIAQFAFPAYIVAICLLLSVLIALRAGQRLRAVTSSRMSTM
jgi:hypothetical protein